jgi:hypothetical protein
VGAAGETVAVALACEVKTLTTDALACEVKTLTTDASREAATSDVALRAARLRRARDRRNGCVHRENCGVDVLLRELSNVLPLIHATTTTAAAARTTEAARLATPPVADGTGVPPLTDGTGVPPVTDGTGVPLLRLQLLRTFVIGSEHVFSASLTTDDVRPDWLQTVELVAAHDGAELVHLKYLSRTAHSVQLEGPTPLFA